MSRRPLRALPLVAALAASWACAPAPLRAPATGEASRAALEGPPASGAATGEAAATAPFDLELAVASFDTAWVRVRNHHYDTTFGGQDWDAVRAELRPEALAAGSDAELRRVIMDMVGRLGVSHYVVIPRDAVPSLTPERAAERAADGGADRPPADAGLELRIVDGRLVAWRVRPEGAAAAAGIASGAAVARLAAVDVGGALDRLEALGDARERQLAESRFLHGVNGMLRGEIGDTMQVGLVRGRDTVPVDLPFRAAAARMVRFGNLPAMFAQLRTERLETADGCVGVLALSVWMTPLAAELDAAIDELRACRGIVIDLRGNPGGVAGMVMGVGGHFVDTRSALGMMRTRTTELRFVLNPRRVNPRGQPVEVFGGRLAILVDLMSASTSEIFAAGMQAIGRARVFGEVTSGQALPAMAGALPNGDVLMQAIADYLVIDGSRVEGRGVLPDETVPLRIDDVRAGRDAPLEAALRWIATGPGD
ncbi:MAG TPA: S41 family peptidase [Longimicrobiales bacterium]|nr:S41 family peptidase [Longimicrobiales bacterium]